MNRKHVFILAGVLTAVGGAIVAVRVFVLGFPLTPLEVVETWHVEARLQFDGTGERARLEMQVPQSAPGMTIISEDFVTGGLGLRTRAEEVNRLAVFTARSLTGQEVLYYRAVVRRSRTLETLAPSPEPTLRHSRYEGAELAAARSIAARIDALSADNRSFQALTWERLSNAPRGREEEVLLGVQPNRARIADVAARIMSVAGIPARAVHGLALEPSRRDAQFSHWTEVYDNGAWIPYDPDSGVNRQPVAHLAWWRGRAPFVHLVGGRALKTDISVSRAFVPALPAALKRQQALDSWLTEFSVFGLPIQTQAVFRILFVLPVGILLLVALRNVVGIQTFGTFMPVLVALGFRDTGLAWGVVLFVIVVASGLAVRAYLEQLRLLMVPRLATIATVVIVIMAILSVISFRLNLHSGLSVSLFPIVILTMTIERMNTVLEEKGTREAMIQMAGTLVAAILAYVVMHLALVEHVMFVFPESLLIILAMLVLLGRYTGYRLLELPRFRALARRR